MGNGLSRLHRPDRPRGRQERRDPAFLEPARQPRRSGSARRSAIPSTRSATWTRRRWRGPARATRRRRRRSTSIAWQVANSGGGEHRPSTGQDMVKGRRTEIPFLNGFVVQEGRGDRHPDPDQRDPDRHRAARRKGRTEARPEAHHRSAAELRLHGRQAERRHPRERWPRAKSRHAGEDAPELIPRAESGEGYERKEQRCSPSSIRREGRSRSRSARSPSRSRQPNEALVAVHAFSLNRGELRLFQVRPEGWRPGQDIAGVVLRAGRGRQRPAGRDAGRRAVRLARLGRARRGAEPPHGADRRQCLVRRGGVAAGRRADRVAHACATARRCSASGC